MLQRTLVAFAPVLLCSAALAAQDSPLVAAARSAQRSQTRFATDLPAPDVRTIRWFNSDRKSLAAFRGRVVLVDFWATWCAPCVTAFPEIERLAKELGPSGFTVVLVHSRNTKTPGPTTTDIAAESVLPAYVRQHHITVPVAIAAENEFESLGIRGIPHYVLIDRRGMVRYSRPGRSPDAATIRALLREGERGDSPQRH